MILLNDGARMVNGKCGMGMGNLGALYSRMSSAMASSEGNHKREEEE